MKMKAMVLKTPASIETSPLELRQIEVPEPAEGEIRLRVMACGVCRTDLHVVEGDLPPKKREIVPGHQVVGVVEARGRGATRFELGARVGIAWLRFVCGTCRFCRQGQENLCLRPLFTGYDENGGYAERAVVRQDFAYPLSRALDPVSVTPLLCAGIIGYRALKRARMGPGKRLGLYGFGSSAHIAIQIAIHAGCTVYVMTRDEKHRNLSLRLGAAWAGPASATPPVSLDSAVLFAPVGDLVPPALAALDRGGTLAIAGIHLTDVPPLDYERHLFYEKNLSSVTANTRADGEELLRLAEEIPLKPQTTRFRLDQANRALQLMSLDGVEGTAVLEIG